MTFQSNAAGDTTLSPELQAAAAAMIQHVKAPPNAVPKEVQLVEKQRGEALAELAINEARGQANAWKRIYVDLLALTAEGRAGFRTITAKHAKEMREHVKANNEASEYKKARASALVRLSELNTISKALDVGAVFNKEWPFHFAVGHARTALDGEGKGDNRGRPAKPWADKLKQFISKNVPGDQLDAAVELVETMAQLSHAAAK